MGKLITITPLPKTNLQSVPPLHAAIVPNFPSVRPGVDYFETAPSPAQAPVTITTIDVEKFLEQKPSLFKLGEPLLKASYVIEGLEEGEPRVVVSGVEQSFEEMPADHERTCFIQARGIIFTRQKKDVRSNINLVLANPEYHSHVLTGVADSKNIRVLEPTGPQLFHTHNLQETDGMQYLADMVGRDAGYGYTYVQKSLDDIDALVKPEDLFSGKRTDLLKNYTGQIQVLEVANGTVIIMEMSANVSRVPVPCSFAADASFAEVRVSGKGVQQRIEDRLKNLYHVATDPAWQRAFQAQFVER